ncbi:MAG: NAD(P)-dependent oxidoreductase [Chloroherpetonaceae bacterium]
MSKVFITDYISNPDIEQSILGDYLTDKLSSDVGVLLVWHEYINEKYCKFLPNLKGVIRYGVGYDTLDLTYLKSRNIVACNTPDYGTEEVADTALAMILNIARGITRYDFLCRSYGDGSWQENTITSLKRTSDTTLGIIGAGRIGGSVALRANALRFRTIIYDKYKERGYEKLLGAQRVESIEELLTLSDIVSIHVPLNSETIGMVDERFISQMRNGASLVNTARGKIVKSLDVFYEPLRIGRLTSVALDVLPDEPPKDCALIRAWQSREHWLDGRLIINPHTAYYSGRAFIEMRQKAAQNALRILKNEEPFNNL